MEFDKKAVYHDDSSVGGIKTGDGIERQVFYNTEYGEPLVDGN